MEALVRDRGTLAVMPGRPNRERLSGPNTSQLDRISPFSSKGDTNN